MKRNIWRYSWPIPLLLALGPRTLSWRRLVWCRWLPRWEVHPLNGAIRSVAFGIRSPRLWWLSVRISLHVRYGFRCPIVVGHNAIEA